MPCPKFLPLHAWHLPLVLQKQSRHLYTLLHVLFILAPFSTHFPHYLAPPVISLFSACKQANAPFKTFPWPSYSLRYKPLSLSKVVFWHVALMVWPPSNSISLFGFCSHYTAKTFLSLVSDSLLAVLSFPSPAATHLFASLLWAFWHPPLTHYSLIFPLCRIKEEITPNPCHPFCATA